MISLDHTHDPAVRSWLDSANLVGTDFPIQNLPFSVFRRRGTQETFRGGVAIGDQVVDLAALTASSALDGVVLQAARAAAQATLNDFFALGPDAWRTLRRALFALLHEDTAPARVGTVSSCLVPQLEAEYTVPARIGDYTDFYTSLDHALNCMRIMYPDADVTPNFRWMPQAYHGRVSTIGVSGQQFHRPTGQWLSTGASAPAPVFMPSARMDYEMELGIWIGQGNAMGKRIPLEQVDEHIFGISLLNDWSVRDIQVWEMTPLGPFHAKNFATTISPWIVTVDALAPYRTAWTRPAADPQPLPYLESAANREAGALDIRLEVSLQSERARREGRGTARLSGTSFRHQYWSIGQMVAHHTAGGCSLNPGDLIGSGTISGPGPGEAGAMIELAQGGQKPVPLGDGDERGFLQDGDTVVMRGWCEKPGAARIGFGECRGTVLPALAV
ncbi:fumarylacetoacetase [Caballeronia sp. LjRoot34]|uniref:fumarylacetoacetase n=1 Tax=Caballeronia sp. LjRoot34 TaxID=3342325 RepID=UPI003ECD7833